MDKRKNNGSKKGGNKGAGRPPKAFEQKLVEKLSPLDETAFKQLKKKVDEGEKWAIELFFKYKYGMPKQQIEQSNTHTVNDFNIKDILGFDKSK